MGHCGRPELHKVSENPGPGTYQAPAKKQKGPTMLGKDKAFIKESPGPGHYTPQGTSVKRKNAQYSMGKQKKDLCPAKPLNDFPGAGSYHNKKRKAVGPSFGFGSAPRMKEYKKAGPGPGDYKIPTKIRDCPNHALGKNQFSYV